MTTLLEPPTILAAGKPPLSNEGELGAPRERDEPESGPDQEEEEV